MALGDEGLLRDLVSPVVGRAGFDLEDLTVTGVGRRQVVRVVIDRDGGVDSDAAAAVSRSISAELDGRGDDVLGGAAYTLEITSPGIGRPLTRPRHFRRAAGHLVSLILADGASMQARILRADEDRVVLLTGTDGLQQQSVPLDEITRATVDVEFAPPSAAVMALLSQQGDAHSGQGEDAR